MAPPSRKLKAIESIIWLVGKRNYLRVIGKLNEARVSLMFVNIELAKLGYHDGIYPQRLDEYNLAMVKLSKGKFYSTRALEDGGGKMWRLAFQNTRASLDLSQALLNALRTKSQNPITKEKPSLTSKGTEILFADDVPLIPEINPIVILSGSDYEMGYQYAQQVVQIFGSWIFEQKSNRRFSEEEDATIRRWEEQMNLYTPEILEMCRGWAAGATDAGVPMSYDDVLDLWTGHKPPAKNYMGRGEAFPPDLPALACSGVAAWGRATTDGSLVTASTGDHDPTHMVTIVAFPKTGNNYVYTPFSVTGDVREVGATWMMGHPGMNNKGVAYVEHGGEARMIEPKSTWGYGIRKGASILHTLRFANSAREAAEMELSYPVGDAGRPLGSVGGFYADRSYGYVLESHQDPLIIREAGTMGETDFLYANNSALHPDAGKAGWMRLDPDNWNWDPHGGWYPRRFQRYSIIKAITRPNPDANALMGLSTMYMNSRYRSQYLFEMMEARVGEIDLEYMKEVYRKSGTIPDGRWEDAVRAYNKTGEWGEHSTGHATNALVVVMRPDDGNDGLYSLCVGTAARGLTSNTPRACPIYEETDAFWELKLAASPQGVAEHARRLAEGYVERGESALSALPETDCARLPLSLMLNAARNELGKGIEFSESALGDESGSSISEWARATRAFTRAQVRALQVCQALIMPKVLEERNTGCHEERAETVAPRPFTSSVATPTT